MSSYPIKDTGGSAFKVDIISDAYSQLRISGLTVQPTPEDLEIALMRLENMMAEWESRNICTGYNFEDTPDPNSDLNVKRAYWHCLATNLAVRMVPDFNKEVNQVLFSQASASLSNLSGRVALDRLNQVQYPRRMARGSGNTLRYNRWARYYRNTFNTPNQCSTIDMFIGDIDDFVEHFDAYLDSGETIASYTITADPGLGIQSDSNNTPDINYRIKATAPSADNATFGQLLTIVVTTSTGRVETRQTIFNLMPRQD